MRWDIEQSPRRVTLAQSYRGAWGQRPRMGFSVEICPETVSGAAGGRAGCRGDVTPRGPPFPRGQ